MEFPDFPAQDDGSLETARARVAALAALLRLSRNSVDYSAMVEGSSENLDGPDPDGYWNQLKHEIDRVLGLLAG
jgi:hypothetical protein